MTLVFVPSPKPSNTNVVFVETLSVRLCGVVDS